jgi:branched-chain amino acid transport system permease protein
VKHSHISPWALFVSLAVIVAIAVVPLWASPYLISFLISVFMYVTLAGSWNLFSGMTGYISLGHGLFFGIGAYAFAVAMVILKIGPFLSFALSAVISGLSAVVLGALLLTTRLRVAYFAMIMLGLNEIMKTVVANTKAIGSSYGLTIPPLASSLTAFYFLLGLAICVTLFTFLLQRSRWGYGLKAILADEIAAEVTGIKAVVHKMGVFIVSACFAGMTGGMIAWYWSYIDPYMAFDLIVSFDMVVMTMFGGIGTVFGPVIGAVLMSALKETLSTSIPHFHTFIFGVVLVLLMIWQPNGMIEIVRFLDRRFRSMRKSSRPALRSAE